MNHTKVKTNKTNTGLVKGFGVKVLDLVHHKLLESEWVTSLSLITLHNISPDPEEGDTQVRSQVQSQ